MSWDTKPLEDLLAPSGKRRAGKQDLPVLSITMKHGLVDQAEKFKKRVASNDTSKYRIAFKNELVVGFPIDEGVLGFQVKYKAGIVSPAYDIWKLKAESETHIPYLERYLRSPQARSLYASRMQGAVARRRSLTKSDFLNLEIPFPPLNDQIRIAHLLGKVEGLIAQRKQHLQQLDDLLKSVFLEMFGDPVRNEKGWDKPELKAFGKISTGNTPPRKDPINYDGEFIEWIKTDNIPKDAMFITNAAECLSEIGSHKARTLKKGALLVACIAGSIESIGRAALTDRPVAFNQQINAIQPAKDVNPFYLYGLFKLSRAYIQNSAAKGMKKIITKGDFEKITMIKPPIEIQNQFATIVEKVEALKSRYQQSLTDLESLYGALSQKAFKGELDLSKVQVPEIDLEENENTLEQDLIKLHEQFKILPEIQESLVTLGYSSPEFERMMAVSKKAVEATSIANELSVIPELNESIMAAQKIMEPLNLPQYAQLQKISDLTKTITDLHKTLGVPFQTSLPSQKYFDSMESLLKVTDQFKLPTSLEKNIMFIDSNIPQSLQSPLDFFNRMLPSGLTNTALDESPLSDPQRREDLLKRIFDSHLSQLNTGDTFSLDELWQIISIRTLDDQEDDTPPIGPADYELVKKWVFEALEADQLKQSRNIVGMDDKGEAIFGNVIELKVGSLQ